MGNLSRRILVSSGRFDPGELVSHRILRAEGPWPEALYSHQPDVLVLDTNTIDAGLTSALAQPIFDKLPIILVAGDAENDMDAAGALLGFGIAAFLPADPPSGALVTEIARMTPGTGEVHEQGAYFDPQGPAVDEIWRNVDRIKAALAELTAGSREPQARLVDAPRIRNHIKARRLREKFFPADLFADPAWDMLLDLAAARLEGRQVAVSSLCIAATVPTTTGLRWIKQMVDRGLFVRHSDPQDARRAFITLSDEAANAMAACLNAMLNLPGQ
ncbi:MAG: hypothetical protein WCZ66_07710 [Sphingomonadaceae bacterium]